MTSFNIHKQGSGAGYPSDSELKPFLDDCECSEWAAAIEDKWPHLKVNSGYYLRDDGSPGDHFWNRHPDGTIIDVASQQFGIKDNLIGLSHPSYNRYISYQHEPDEAQAQAHLAGHHDSPEDYADCCLECSKHCEASMKDVLKR